MKNLKKVLALVLACVMVFGTITMAAGTGYPDVADDAAYAEAVKTLSALEIIKGDENGNFNPDATITRAEMAKILCAMLNSGELATTETKFNDVPATHWASGYIKYAQQLGIIDGYDAVTFGPEDPVTYEQVVKLVMAALGYTYKANENGGYPTGYLYVAANAEVLKGAASKGGNEAAARSTVAVIANNAMNTPVMERTTYGTESLWEELDGTNGKSFVTLLTKMHVYKVEGKITNSYKNDTTLKDGYVDTKITKALSIDPEKAIGATVTAYTGTIPSEWVLLNVDASASDAEDYVGLESAIYFKEADAGDIVVINVAPKSAKNKSITVAADNAFNAVKDANIDVADKPSKALSGDYLFSYWNDRDEDSRISTIDIASTASIYVNNGAEQTFATLVEARYATNGNNYAEALVYVLVPTRGNITFIDTNNDGEYDLIKKDSYEVVIVDSVNTKTNRINFKAEKTAGAPGYIIISNEAKKNLKEYSITLDGADIDVADLAPYDVLNIRTNSWSDPTFYEIEATRKVVEGKVTQTNTTATPNYVVIEGEKYTVVDATYMAALPKLGDEGKFFLDANGDIALTEAASAVNGNYAYLYSTGAGTFGELYVRMFTKDAADVSYELSAKVEINEVQKATATTQYTLNDIETIFGETLTAGTPGEALMTAGDVFTAPTVATATALTPELLIKELAAGSALKAPYTISGDTTADRFITYTIDSSNKITNIALATSNKVDEFGYVAKETSAKEWKSALNKFEGSYALADNAVIFFVDPAKSIEDYSVKTIAGLVDGNSYAPFFFSKTDNGCAAALVKNVVSNLDTAASLAIFLDYAEAKIDYDTVYYITYFKDGAVIETPLVATAAMGTTVKAMNKGDAFLFGLDQKGQVDQISKVFMPGTTAPALNTVGAFDGLYDATVADFKEIGTAGDKDNEIFFGYVGKISSIADGVRLTLLDEQGKFSNMAQSAQQVINVPSSAKVTVYNAGNADAKKVMAGTTSDIAASFFKKDVNGDFDFAGSDIKDMSYAFVRVYKDVVTEVIYVRYYRD